MQLPEPKHRFFFDSHHHPTITAIHSLLICPVVACLLVFQPDEERYIQIKILCSVKVMRGQQAASRLLFHHTDRLLCLHILHLVWYDRAGRGPLADTSPTRDPPASLYRDVLGKRSPTALSRAACRQRTRPGGAGQLATQRGEAGTRRTKRKHVRRFLEYGAVWDKT